jgi:hypothetical protein
MTKSLHLRPLPAVVADGFITRQCEVARYSADQLEDSVILYFKFPAIETFPADDDCDAYVLATFMDAMKEDRNVVVKGSVSKQLIGNLFEFNLVWKKWVPSLYHVIELRADTVRQSSVKNPGALSAFSGGVDASFTVYQHHMKHKRERSQDIKLCALIHGFDIPLSDPAVFSNALGRARATLSDLGIPIMPVETNAKQIARVNWEDAFTCMLIGALNNLKSLAGTCLIGSSRSYDTVIIPAGSSPYTDELLSSGEFDVMHDGASHSRTEKVAEVAKWKVGADNLRVCWEGDLTDRNCGECEKCLRTMLNFLASGNPIPAAFPNVDIVQKLDKIMLKRDAIVEIWEEILTMARKNNIKAPWVDAVARTIKRKPLKKRLFPDNSLRKKVVKSVYRCIIPYKEAA